MPRLPLRDLIVKKARPQTTLNVEDAFLKRPGEMVETYIFTDSIRQHFEQILDTVAKGQGQGFWVQAEYGAGKTHFLAVLAALLSRADDRLWDRVDDPAIRQFWQRLKHVCLLPVVCSLRGEASADPLTSRTLMDVLLEKGLRPALERAGLADRVRLTSTEDLMDWYDQRAAPVYRTDFESYVQKSTGVPLKQLRDTEGDDAIAELLAKYLESFALKPDIATSVKDRLASIYRRVMSSDAGYTGLLVIIDEYEGWSNIRSGNDHFRAQDEDFLETLGFLLPRDSGMAVHTVVASQSAVPAKLHGGQEGDRFINLPLLADRNERDYDIIASRRVRGLNLDRMPELNDYYRYYSETFDFARQLKEAEFRDIFPFQPRCFEIVRRITSRDLPGPRSGIQILYELVSEDALLTRDTLIRASDLTASHHLVEDCLSKPVYKKHYDAYRLAWQELPTLGLDAGDLELAKNILTTLYLWHEALLERPRPMTVQDLTQATLTTADVVKAEDNVEYVLTQMQALQQVQFEKPNAQFVPIGGDGPSPIAIFKDWTRRTQNDPHAVRTQWTDSLFLTTEQTRSQPGLFAEFTVDSPVERSFDHRNLQYRGQVVIASRWQLDWGLPLTEEDVHFRIVILTPEAAHSVKASDLQDSRIAVIFPGTLTEDATRAAAEHLAWNRMSEEYKNQTGKEAEQIRDWLSNQRSTLLSDLLQTQLSIYKNGSIITRDDLGISAKEAFTAVGNERRIGFIVEKLLSAAYSQLPINFAALRSTLTSTEASKVFEGYFNPGPSGAQTTATKNYGLALGLSHIDQPSRFAPQSGQRALDLMNKMLAESNGELQVWTLFDRLAKPPYGLPYIVTQLYLLAFVRQGNPRVDLMLKRDHKLKSRDGQPFGRDRINAASVATIQWRSGMDKAFDVLVPGVGPNWNDVLGYAHEIVEDLHPTTDQAEIETQSQRLAERLKSLGTEVTQQRNQLAVLERALNAKLPDNTTQPLVQLETLAQLRNGYASFYEKAEELFKTADGLRDAMKVFYRARDLAGIAAEISEAKHYLEAVHLRESDRELNAQKSSLLGQIDLTNLAGQPHLWSGIQANFDQFKARYRNEYQKHHRDTNTRLQQLSQTLANVPRQLHALQLLNSIHELGSPRGEHLSAHYERLIGSLQPCSIKDYLAVTVNASPTCAECHRDLTYAPPESQVETLSRELNAALAEQQRRLGREAVLRILSRGKGDALSQFVQAIQVANTAALVDLVDEETVKVIRRLLAEEQIGFAEGAVLDKFLHQFGSLEEGDIPRAVHEFERLLRQAFEEAKKTNKDKKTIRLTLK